MSGLVVGGVATNAPEGVAIRTFQEAGVVRFASKGSRGDAGGEPPTVGAGWW